MQANVTPSILTAAVIGAVSTITFPSRMGNVVIINLGTGVLWVTWDGTNPVASFGDGRLQLNSGQSFSVPYSDILTVKAISSTTASLQVVGTPSAKNGSAGGIN